MFCVVYSNAQSKVDWSKQAEKAVELVAKLPEVIKADKQCRYLSKGKRHLVSFVTEDPTQDNNFFQVNVAEDNGSAYHTWFIFQVEPLSYKIYYYDIKTGDNIPLKKWRKNYKAYI